MPSFCVCPPSISRKRFRNGEAATTTTSSRKGSTSSSKSSDRRFSSFGSTSRTLSSNLVKLYQRTFERKPSVDLSDSRRHLSTSKSTSASSLVLMSSPSVFDTPSSTSGSVSGGGGHSRNSVAPMQNQYGRTILFSNTSNTPMEGSLSKWTNVMKGWQFRWFVLDEATGLLSYYTSKEKMRRGVRRGCIRLQGAVLGIDDEDDANFTITVDAKVFHLQAKDAEEREVWVRALEDAILKHTRLRPCYKSRYFSAGDPSIQPLISFEQRLAQADVYLQMLIQQIGELDGRPELSRVVAKGNEFLSAIKHTIVLLQIAKNTAFPVPDVASPIILRYAEQDPEIQIGIAIGSEAQEGESGSVGGKSVSKFPLTKSPVRGSEQEAITGSIKSPAHLIQSPVSPVADKNPVLFSYSSSDDEQDFYDAEDFSEDNREETEYSSKAESVDAEQDRSSRGEEQAEVPPGYEEVMKKTDGSGNVVSMKPLPAARRKPSVEEVDYDSLYDNQSDDELDSLESHGSVISHLLSQVKIGMDLTKVVLPTFILERRSLLEMYADFFAHPDMFVNITDFKTPKDRIVAVLRWYLGSFHAGRRSEVAKKPYNPILGEVFQCYWDLPTKDSTKSNINSGGDLEHCDISSAKLLPWVDNEDAVMFFAEQVSHHPPISAFYAEHLGKKISLNAHIWTKSKFLGLSIGVINIGHALLTLHSPVREDYVLGFPNGYARSILTTPWVELGGPVTISCTQTGFNATVEFKTKPFFSGDKNKISAQVFSPDDKKKPFLTVEGEWNGLMTGKWIDGRTEKFVDVKRLDITKKQARRVADQEIYESRRMWKEVTAGLKFRDIDKATEAKFKLEEKQRHEARHRGERKESWRPRKFIPAGDTWIFTDPLEQRLKQLQKGRATVDGSGAGTGQELPR